MIQLIKISSFVALLIMSASNYATTVQFQTSLGDFEVELFDNDTPITVANFLEYVNDGAYTDTIIHRSVRNFIIQGGGFTWPEDNTSRAIDSRAAITNEPVFSNVTGTIAMAKLGGNANSATNQWFFNLGNNSATLDNQNGGFTVFGQVTSEGMDIINAIAAVPVYNLGGTFANLPLMNLSSEDLTNGAPIAPDDVITILAIVVTDADVDSAAGLEPALNTSLSSGGDGGGGASWVLSVLLAFSLFGRLVIDNRTSRHRLAQKP